MYRIGRGRPGFFPERFVGACRRLRCAPGAAAVCDVTPADYAAQVPTAFGAVGFICKSNYQVKPSPLPITDWRTRTSTIQAPADEIQPNPNQDVFEVDFSPGFEASEAALG